jgi:predicted outer membrane repeat protein
MNWLLVALGCFDLAAQEPPSTVVDRCTSDSDPGGVNLATALQTGGNITFNCGGRATIRITQRHSIERPVSIDGGGVITLDGGGTSGFLSAAQPTAIVGLSRITLRAMKGVTTGSNAVTIADSVILDSDSPIAARGLVRVNRSTFEGNRGAVITASGLVAADMQMRRNRAIAISISGGGANIQDSVIEDNGESIFADCGDTIFLRTTFTRNTTLVNALRPGGAMRVDCSSVEIINSSFSENKSNSDGGALHIGPGVRMISIRGSRFTGNSAARGGGAVSIETKAAAEPDVRFKHTIFKSNAARWGGAVFHAALADTPVAGLGKISGEAVTFSGNTASERGGAIAVEAMALDLFRAAFLGNAAPSGGAIWHEPAGRGPNALANAIFALNKSGDGVIVGRALTLANSTVLGSEGAGVLFLTPSSTLLGFEGESVPFLTRAKEAVASDTITFANTIVENNSGGNCRIDAARIVPQGINLQFPDDGCGRGFGVAAALLDTFYAPLIGGPARANGLDNICAGALVRSVDFYGNRRPMADRCSIGAVEGDVARVVSHLKQPKPRPPFVKGRSEVGSKESNDDEYDGDNKGKSAGGESKPDDGGAPDDCKHYPDSARCKSSGETASCASYVGDLPPEASMALGKRKPSALLAKLLHRGVDFSVPLHKLESWLANQHYTPYPAISEAIIKLMGNKRLKCPVYIDVIVWNYEHSNGVDSPRKPSHVKLNELKSAIVGGYNTRYAISISRFEDLLQ